MKDDVMNIELRKEILKRALVAEEGVRKLLLFVLNTRKEDRKAISKKSSVLSFNDKINILFDLEVINSDEYKNFSLLSEFRNKFMHDIDCFSFKEAVDIFEKFNNQGSKGKELLKFHQDKSKHKKDGTEDDYRKAYFKLAEDLYDIISKKMNSYIEEKTENYNFISKLVDYNARVAVTLSDIVGIIINNNMTPDETKRDVLKEVSRVLPSEDLKYINKMLANGIANRFIFKLPSDICGRLDEKISSRDNMSKKYSMISSINHDAKKN